MFQVEVTTSWEEKYLEILNVLKGEVISFGISDQYVPDATVKETLREYIANEFDAVGTNFKITELEKGVLLEDESEIGIQIEDLVVGKSNSRELTYKIGNFGEGFKVFAIPALREGRKIVIETIGHTIIFFLDFEEKLNSKVLKAKVVPNKRKKGNSIYLGVGTEKLQEAKEMFLFLNENLEKVNDVLYINHANTQNQVFVNTLAGQKIHSFFSYALRKKQRINRDRNIIEAPYHDIALEILGSKDKEMLKLWLPCLAKDGFEKTFEFELVQYVANNLHRKDFKNLDFSLVQEVAKEIDLKYIGYVRYKEEGYAFKYAHPEKHLMISGNSDIYRFCEKVLKNMFSPTELNYAIEIDKKYHVPAFDVQSVNNSLSEDMVVLFQELQNCTLLKDIEFEGNNIKFNLRNLNKVNIIEGRTTKRNFAIRTFFRTMHRLLKTNKVILKNWDVNIKKDQKFPLLVVDKIPSHFTVQIKDIKTVGKLSNNIFFNQAKQILKDYVYQLQGNQQYLIDKNYQIGEESNSLYSYRDMTTSYARQEVLASATVMKTLLKVAQEGKLSKYPYEIEILEKEISSIRLGNTSHWRQRDLKNAVTSQFKAIFGSKTVISTNDKSDKKARYNGYKIFNGDKTIEKYCRELGVAPSSSVRGTDTEGKDIIEKPQALTWKEYKDSPYRKVVLAMSILQKTLEDVYEMTNNQSDKKGVFIKGILPYSTNNDLKHLFDGYLTNSNYKKVTREYVFEVFDRTHLVEEFTSYTTNGLHSVGTILLKNDVDILGTFFHEYIHFSTNLKDIDTNFEKMLAFVGLIANKNKNQLTEKDEQSWLKDYKKWSTGGKN